MAGRIIIKIGAEAAANVGERRVAGGLVAIEHEAPIPFLANFSWVYVAVRSRVTKPPAERAPVSEQARH